jgi:hypothetical protein
MPRLGCKGLTIHGVEVSAGLIEDPEKMRAVIHIP